MSWPFLFLPSEVIEAYILWWDTEVVTHLENRSVHQRRSTEVELDILRSIVLSEVVIDHSLVYETCKAVTFIFHVLFSVPIIFWQWLRKDYVELEVRELFLNVTEVFQVEELTLRTSTVPEAHLTVGLQRVEQVEEV